MLADGGLVVVDHVKIVAHRGSQGDVCHDVQIICEGVLVKSVQVVGVADGIANFVRAHDPQFIESETDAATKLIAHGNFMEEKFVLQIVDLIVFGGSSISRDG